MPAPALLNMFAAHTAAAASGPPVAGYVAWYDASDTGSITASGGRVSQWNDLSGNGWHLTQGTAGLQPLTGSVSVNGLNAIAFGYFSASGADNAMDSPAGLTISQPNTTFLVVRLDANGNGFMIDGLSGRQILGTTNPNYAIYAGSFVSSSAADTTGAHVWSANFNGASSELFIDGASNATGDASTGNYTAGLRVGRASTDNVPASGRVCEIIFYSSLLGTTNRQSVEAYLKAKWGTP